jgi:hypothetical protein
MYGFINRAVEEYISEHYGRDTWQRIREKAGYPDEPFLTMERYDDKVTYDLMGVACAEIGMKPEEMMFEFGRHWIQYTAVKGYGDILVGAGDTLPQLLKSLDHMHTRVKLSFPNLEPPSFSVSDETATSLVLHYYSHRPGLAPLVLGILKGLETRFALDIAATLERDETSVRPHDLFRISWKAKVPAASGTV